MKCCKTKFESIIDGWGNLVFKKPEIEILAKERARVCAICPQNESNRCKMCMCYIPAKVRSRIEICPGGLW